MKRMCMALAMLAICALALTAESKMAFDLRTVSNLTTVDFEESGNNKGPQWALKDLVGIVWTDDVVGGSIIFQVNAVDSTIKVDEYWGWIKLGQFKVTGGEFDNRVINRVKDEESTWLVWEKFKYGALLNGKQVAESDNTALWGKNDLSVEFKTGNLILQASAGTSDLETDKALSEVFGSRIAYTITDTAKLAFTFVQYKEDNATIGLFAEILGLEGISLVAGYSGVMNYDESDAAVHGMEVRARYKSGNWALTSHNNFSFADESMTFYNMMNFSWKYNDMITAALYANNIHVMGDAPEAEGLDGNALIIRPGVTFTARKGATIDTGLEFCFSKKGDSDMVSTMGIPLSIRVKF